MNSIIFTHLFHQTGFLLQFDILLGHSSVYIDQLYKILRSSCWISTFIRLLGGDNKQNKHLVCLIGEAHISTYFSWANYINLIRSGHYISNGQTNIIILDKLVAEQLDSSSVVEADECVNIVIFYEPFQNFLLIHPGITHLLVFFIFLDRL